MTAKRLQNRRSKACGQHAVAYILKRAGGESTERYLSHFVDDKKRNDFLACRYVRREIQNLT